jgi:hypothetical protein
MKAYLIDEISGPDMEKIREYLRKNGVPSGLDRVFWIHLPEELLSPEQQRHPGCRPHAFAVELGRDSMKAEFFIRSSTSLQCTCPDYATDAQKAYILSFTDDMLARLGVRT